MADYRDKSDSVIVKKGDSFSDDMMTPLIQAGITAVSAAPATPTEIACAQLCGLGHYRMRGFVTIQTEDEYKAWLADQASYLTQ